jgi:hypothetical protein
LRRPGTDVASCASGISLQSGGNGLTAFCGFRHQAAGFVGRNF